MPPWNGKAIHTVFTGAGTSFLCWGFILYHTWGGGGGLKGKCLLGMERPLLKLSTGGGGGGGGGERGVPYLCVAGSFCMSRDGEPMPHWNRMSNRMKRCQNPDFLKGVRPVDAGGGGGRGVAIVGKVRPTASTTWAATKCYIGGTFCTKGGGGGPI